MFNARTLCHQFTFAIVNLKTFPCCQRPRKWFVSSWEKRLFEAKMSIKRPGPNWQSFCRHMSNMSCFSFHMILDSEKYRLLVTCTRALSKRSVKTITSGVMIIVDVQRLDNAFYRINVNKTNHAICWIVIYSCSGGYKNNSLHLARKFARIFVLGHYLFRVPNIFLRASGSRKIAYV